MPDKLRREMLHDPEIYPNPMEFIPERFHGVDSEMAKASNLAFGFGRRICPGMHFAEGTLFSVIMTTLATCDVLAGLDENGQEVMPKYAYTSGTIRYEPCVLKENKLTIRSVSQNHFQSGSGYGPRKQLLCSPRIQQLSSCAELLSNMESQRNCCLSEKNGII